MFRRFWIYVALFIAICSAEEVHFLSTGEDPEAYVKNKIASHDVMVFARSYGPHNQQTKDLLKEMEKKLRVTVEYVDLDLMPGFDGSLIMQELQKISGQWALPNIYIGKKHVGGNSELDQLRGLGMLEAMILEAGDEL